MSRFSAELRNLLAPAAEAARVALVALEADVVPASLRRVVGHSGGRLPPPLATSLLEALDDDDWLRGLAAAELQPELASSAAAAFLNRGEGWWVTVAAQLAERRIRDVEKEAERAVEAARKAQDRLDVAGKRLKTAGAELETERAKSRTRRAPEVAPAAGAAAAIAAEARVSELESDLAAENRDRIDAESMIARLRSRVVSLRREQRAQAKSASGSSLGDDSIALAKQLDLIASAAPHRTEPAAQSGRPPAEEPRLELPSGIRPDAREAIEWLASREAPVTVIVDGYNVLRNAEPGAFTTRRNRDRLAHDLARLRRRSGTARVVVVYDSDLPGDRDPHVVQGELETHFSAEDELADDEIVNLVGSARGGVIVITSDRELRERTHKLGALTLWSEALNDWTSG